MNQRFPTLLSQILALTAACALPCAAADFEKEIQPLLKEYCLGCHSTEKHKGELDMERFASFTDAKQQPKVWQAVVEQLLLGEMPPKEKPQPTSDQRDRLVTWANALLDEIALERAGDPGPVVLRRLSNAEYTYTIRDLTGVASLDPVKEFPTDSASGEGFMNVGNSLVMSPSLVTKYLDAAKDIASHAVLLPDGIRFSPSTSQRDWTEERLAAIRAFYAEFTEKGGGSSVNLQGIKFDTKDGGVLPLQRYLAATLSERSALTSGAKSISDVARDQRLNGKYLALLWNVLNDKKPSLLLDPLRARWWSATSDDAAALAGYIAQWQQALWRFTQVGHIGKRDGPKAWQAPVTPLASAREVRVTLPASVNRTPVTLYLAVSDAGDGNENDFAVWENPRLVAPGRTDLPLRDVRTASTLLSAYRDKILSSTAKCLAAAAEATDSANAQAIDQLAGKHGIEPPILAAWLNCLGIGTGETRIDSHMTQKTESAQNYDFIKGWTGADALSVIANSSDQHVRVPGNMKPHSVAVHPSPQRRVIVGWRAPAAAMLSVEGTVQHAHPECGNGVTWAIELRRGNTRQLLGNGTAQGSKEIACGPFEDLTINAGDVIALLIGPRDGNHSCDLTAVDLNLSDGVRIWNLAGEVSPNILAGNPHADSFGDSNVWHFFSEPENRTNTESVLPAGSLLAKWQSSGDTEQKRQIAEAVQALLIGGAASVAKDDPDSILFRQLTSLNGPLLSGILRAATANRDHVLSASLSESFEDGNPETNRALGLDPALFGQHPNGAAAINATSLCVKAPSVIELRIPADLAEGCEFVATATLHKETGAEGSVQMLALTQRPDSPSGLVAGATREQGGKSTWSDGERPVVSDSPIIVADGGAARQRVEAALDEFRQLFPAALCYTKIVPVDEVVTLTLYYREDDQLKRLMLNDTQAAALDRLWDELQFVSLAPLKLVDAFEQLWQFATQDADPSAFEPLREPIKQRAEAFKKLLIETQSAHLDAVLKFADRAYRRPLTENEKDDLRALYRRLRDEELPHDAAIRLALARVLVAPAFLYHAEKPGSGDQPSPVTDWELATRLSYFLWSSMPDAELRSLADSGQLHEPGILDAQTRRMLRDPKTRRLATEFACAWLHIYEFEKLDEKSERHFPTFTSLRGAMYEETIRFFTDLFQRDGSVLDILDADYTFLNEDLAQHYGIPDSLFRSSRREEALTKHRDQKPDTRNDQSLVAAAATVQGSDEGWRRVDGMKQFSRGGVLGLATTLSKQSGASRTSPILRGNWVAEVLLGEKLPRPPADVPRLPEDETTETLTVRELTEKHGSDPKCYGCHRRIDPYGYSLEGFDAIGRLRDRDLGGRPIDTKAKVMDGSEFDGLDGLRDYLLTKRRDTFLRQFCRKLLGYSLGRSVMLSDSPLVSEMSAQLEAHNYRISAAIGIIVRSKQFTRVRGLDMRVED